MFWLILGILGIPAIIWDVYAEDRWRHSDHTVSHYAYKTIHRFPLLGEVAAFSGAVYWMQDPLSLERVIQSMILIGLLVHFTWAE